VRPVRLAIVALALVVGAWLVVSFRDAHRLDGAATAVKSGTPARLQSALGGIPGARLLYPDRSTPLGFEVTLNVRLGRPAAARAAAESLVRLEPDNAEAWALLSSLTQQSDPARSAQAFAQVRRLDPYDAKRVR
jgi:hypothetical protein